MVLFMASRTHFCALNGLRWYSINITAESKAFAGIFNRIGFNHCLPFDLVLQLQLPVGIDKYTVFVAHLCSDKSIFFFYVGFAVDSELYKKFNLGKSCPTEQSYMSGLCL